MKVLEIKTHKTLDVNDAYGARLIEQGKAVLAPAAPEKAEAEPVAEPARAKGKGEAK